MKRIQVSTLLFERMFRTGHKEESYKVIKGIDKDDILIDMRFYHNDKIVEFWFDKELLPEPTFVEMKRCE